MRVEAAVKDSATAFDPRVLGAVVSRQLRPVIMESTVGKKGSNRFGTGWQDVAFLRLRQA
jgi:hypothetical protein